MSYPADKQKSGEGKPAPRTAPSGRRRKSCDFCTKRKRGCDGMHPCSFCIAKNQSECHYSVRLLTGPKADSASKRASKGRGNRLMAAGGAVSGGDSGGLASARGLHSATIPLKRARLSPSLATGLVGLRENLFIGDFFRTMGFLPFTTESFIRKAMVSTMFRAMQERSPGIRGYPGRIHAAGEEDGRHQGAMVSTAGARSGVCPDGDDDLGTESKIESAAATCVLWSTVGVGCLIGGRPKSSVEGYVHLAREALSVCFDDGSVQTARAFTAMAVLQNFLGNADKFNKYIHFAKTIVRALPQEEVPVDLTDTLQFMKACDMFVAYHHKLDEEDLKDAEETVANGYESCSSMVKDPRLIQQAELFRWLVKTDIRLAACFSMDMYKSASTEDGNTPSRDSVSSGVRGGDGAINGGDGAVELSTNPPALLVVCDEGVAHANTVGLENSLNSMQNSPKPPPPGEMSRKFAADVLPECQLLRNVTQSPTLRGGVGELYAQSIMAYVYSLQGNQEGAMDGLWRCTDIFVKNPGICRFTAWTHVAHCTLACLVLSGFERKYEELRNAYNSVVEEDSVCSVKVPPIEEWNGMICENAFCRSVYNLLVMEVPVLNGAPAGLSDQAFTSTASTSTTVVPEGVPLTPKSEDEDRGVDINLNTDESYSSSTSDDSWAKRIFAERLPADARDGKGQVFHGAPAEAATRVGSASAAAYPPPGCEGAFGGGAFPVAQQLGARGQSTGSGFGPAAGSSAVSTGARYCCSNSSSKNTGGNSSWSTKVGTGGSAAAPAAAPSPSRAPGHGIHGAHREGVGSAPLSLLSPLPSALSRSAPGEDTEGLELFDVSELEGANAAGLLDAVDALLGEAVLEGFGEGGSSEDDLQPFCSGNVERRELVGGPSG